MSEIFVPGRLCLFGEHSDWAGEYRKKDPSIPKGKTLVMGINRGLHAKARKFSRFSYRINYRPFEKPIDMEEMISSAKGGNFFSYVCGTVAAMMGRYDIGGIQIDVKKADLPIKKGLSSSAAACVLVATAYNKVYNLGLSTRDIMDIAYEGEILTGSKCGRMDQVCAMGPGVTQMEFDGDEVGTTKIDVGGKFDLAVVDLDGRKNTRKILKSLNEAYPTPRTDEGIQAHLFLGPMNHKVIKTARQCIEDGDSEGLGNIMNKSQKMFDELVAPMCPDQLKAPKLHNLLNDEDIGETVWGGKGVGSGGDGSAQFVLKDKVGFEEVMGKKHDFLDTIYLTLS